MAMDTETHHFGGDWANDAFVTLHHNELQADKWPAFGNPAYPNPTYTIPPSLLTQGAIERFGQVTPPEERSPTSLSREARETSIPVEELRNEALFPDHQLQALQNFHSKPDQQPQAQEQSQLASPPLSSSTTQQQDEGRASKRRRTSRNTSSTSQASSTATEPSSAQPPADNPQPPKRKRGRPKSQPQMIEAFTADGFPFQVSSARQSHLEKNRVAAHKCRQRKKEYIGSLESRAREHAAKNKALKENIAMLREELLELKNEVLRHAGCGFWAVDEYLTRCAGDLLGIHAPAGDNGTSSRMQQTNFSTTSSRSPDMFSQSQSQSPVTSTLEPGKTARQTSVVSSTDSLEDEFNGFDLLRDIDEENEGQVV